MGHDKAQRYQQMILQAFYRMLDEQLELERREYAKNGPNSPMMIYYVKRIAGIRKIIEDLEPTTYSSCG